MQPSLPPSAAGRVLAPLLLLLLVSTLSLPAGAKGVQFGYKLRDKVQEGGADEPAIFVSPSTTAVEVNLSLKRSDGKVLHFQVPRVPANDAHEFHWPQPAGRLHYQAALTASTTQGEQVTTRFEFDILVVAPLQVKILADQLDLQHRLLVFEADRPVAKAELELFDEDKQLIKHEQQLSAAAGEAVRLQWPETGGTVKRIEMRVYDREGFWAGQEFQPWWVEIPHEEINFDTGKSSFHGEEEKKLDRTMKAIGEVLAVHAKDADLRLYVAGYTDTVGTLDSNQTLSLERALAIARAFRGKGLSLPIFYQGFGETVLATPTADEVDEPRNRRAIYVLGNAPPPPSGAIPRAEWRKL